jgi:hypothetical protein
LIDQQSKVIKNSNSFANNHKDSERQLTLKILRANDQLHNDNYLWKAVKYFTSTPRRFVFNAMNFFSLLSVSEAPTKFIVNEKCKFNFVLEFELIVTQVIESNSR